MKLLEHTAGADRSVCQALAKRVPALAAEFNSILAKHGIKDMEIHSFSFGKKPGLAKVEAHLVQGVGMTEDGLWAAGKYDK